MKDGGFETGEVVDGRYRVEGPLGAGGMATVVRAHDLGRGVPVAIKVLGVDLGVDADALLRFEREAELAALVDRDPGVVRVWSAGRHRGRMFIAMELIQGEDLSRLFARGLAPAEVTTVVAAVARTMARCHARGVIHRDLKPANILVRTEDGRPLVADFGLARATQSRRLTRTGELLGTPAYMAPEQVVDSARAVDARVDVYSLGAILYEGLSGRPPFAGSVLEVLRRVLEEEPPPPSKVRPGVPADLEAICARAMSKEVARRYTAEGLALDLERSLRGEGLEGGHGERRRAAPPLTLWLAVAAVAAAVLAVVLAGGSERAARARLAEAQVLLAPALEDWALGLGAAPPPAKDDVVARASALAAARQHLAADDVARADEALAWLGAVTRALDRSSARATGRSGPADVVVDALVGDGPPLERLGRVRAASPPEAPSAGRLRLRVEARLWRDALARADRLTTLGDYASARSRLAQVEPALPDVRAADASFDALLDREPRALVREALAPTADPASIVRRLEALPPRRVPDPSASARLALELDEDVAAWADALRLQPTGQPDRPLALLQVLGAALRAVGAPEEGPALRATLDAVTDELAVEAEARAGDVVVLRRALAFDAARVRFVAAAPPPSGFAELVTWKLLREGWDRVELVLAGLRCGFTARSAEWNFGEQADELLKARPWSRAAAYLALRGLLDRAQFMKVTPELAERRLDLARAVLRPGLTDDLAPHFLADACEELARALVERAEVRLSRGEHPRSAAVLADASASLQLARQAIAHEPEDGGSFRDAWLTLSRGVLLLQPDAGEALYANGLAVIEGWLARPGLDGHAQERWGAARAMLLMSRAELHLVRGDAEAARTLAGGARAATMRLELIIDAIAIEVRALLALGRGPEAEALIGDRLKEGLGDSDFASAAIDAALAVGRREEARERLERAVAADPSNTAGLRQHARERGLE
jgi:tetratricopeptide (TPR) repeat protein/predicted Ser/Thr protein kinase